MCTTAEDQAYRDFKAMIAWTLGMDPEEVPRFLSPAQVSLVIGETEATVRRGIKEGRIAADKANGRWKICIDTLLPNTREAMRRDAELVG